MGFSPRARLRGTPARRADGVATLRVVGIAIAITALWGTASACHRARPEDSGVRTVLPGQSVTLSNGVRISCPRGWNGSVIRGGPLLESLTDGTRRRVPGLVEEVDLWEGGPLTDPPGREPGDSMELHVQVWRPREAWVALKISEERGWRQGPREHWPARVVLRPRASTAATLTCYLGSRPKWEGSGDRTEAFILVSGDLRGRDPFDMSLTAPGGAASFPWRSVGPTATAEAFLQYFGIQVP